MAAGVYLWLGSSFSAEAGLCSALLVVSEPALLAHLGLETAFYLCLVTWTFVAFQARKQASWGVLGGLAALCRPDAALLFFLLVSVEWVRERRAPWRVLQAAARRDY